MIGKGFVSVIIVNYNGEDFIEDCLKSVQKIDYPNDMYEIILVDNASKDNSINVIRKKFPSVKLIALNSNTGFSAGNNVGVKNARGDLIVFLNPDTTVEKNWLSALVEKIYGDDRIGACSSKVLYIDDRSTINTVGGWWSIVGIPGSMGEGMEKDDVDDGMETFFPTGSSMIIRKEFYKKLGGFDNDYFMYCEDADLGWRLLNRNYKVVLASNSIAYHKVGGSIKDLGNRGFSEIYYFYSTRNRLLTILKNARMSDIIWMLPLYYLSHFIWTVMFAAVGNTTAAKATLNGMWLRNSGWYNKRRKSVKTGYANVKMLGFVDTFKMFFIKRRKHLK